MPCCERGNTNNMCAHINGALGRFFRRLEQRANTYIHSKIAKCRGNDLCAPVMAILTKLGHI